MITALALTTVSVSGVSGQSPDWASEPMAETTKVVMAIEDGPLPNALGRYASQIKRDLNIDLEFARHPFTEQYPTEYLDLTNSGRFDLLSFWPTYMGDFGPFLAKLGDVAPNGVDQAYADMQMDDVHPGYRWVAYEGEDLKALQYDGDVKVLYYRKDVMEDPAEQAAYKTQFGTDLACPTSYDEYLQQAQFFTRPADDFYGAAEIRRLPQLLHLRGPLHGYGWSLLRPGNDESAARP